MTRKKTYPRRAREAFGDRLREVQQFWSKIKRDTSNPLFRINLTHAMMRDNVGCLHRRSWLASKKRSRLSIRLAYFIAYRNYQRPRKNGEEKTPAQCLDICPKPIPNDVLLGWRQDWNERSIPIHAVRGCCRRVAHEVVVLRGSSLRRNFQNRPEYQSLDRLWVDQIRSGPPRAR